ncbi:hypothetical protein [Amycolatopsis sp.]|uniref:hypothetical protein n=1 Tax=Amycolatopsis sp. TaxID=37632 RepID=UPI002CDA4A10|nr:hypothetical protein [Amycolatopsis sp.]HVV07933.1 hypothetical protein [Amycolatopsis sp.]
MIPTVTQQLEAIRRRLAETVVPELPESAEFAHEQVLLIDAALGFLIETHEHEYRYAVVEHHDYRTVLGELARLGGTTDRPVLDALDESGPGETDAVIPLPELTERTRTMKVLVERLYRRLSADGVAGANELMADLAARQVGREASWFRQAGFTLPGSAHIGSVLEMNP